MISLAHARAIAIAAQGLDQRPISPTKADVLATIRRLAIVQIDTIHVVARSPYFVLWSRLGDYDPRWFDELQYPDGLLFEYWAHAASFLPSELWPLLRPAMLRYSTEGWPRAVQWLRDNVAVVEHVRAAIRESGPLRSADFAAPADHPGGGWWNWKPTKTALDLLWSMGELMIQRRVNFHRVYELTERMLPTWNDAAAPTFEQAREQLAEIGLRALGIATTRQLPDYFRQKRAGFDALLRGWVAEGRAVQVQVEGWDAPAYIHRDNLALLENPPTPTLTTLLSPFDSLIWDRERTLAFWGFEYKIECYTPAAKRRYGYFTLPILWRDTLVGRVDAKAERKAGIFRVFALHLEPGVPPVDELFADIARALRECAAWHRTPRVIIERSDPPEVAALVQEIIASA